MKKLWKKIAAALIVIGGLVATFLLGRKSAGAPEQVYRRKVKDAKAKRDRTIQQKRRELQQDEDSARFKIFGERGRP